MPSPFPGMDPYLEGPHWMTVHHALSGEIYRWLAPRVRPRYIVYFEERLVMDTLENLIVARSAIVPDVSLVGRRPEASGQPAATLTAPLELETVMPALVPHVTIEIRDAQNRQLVTAIEVLSPTNKQGEGRREYLEKRARLLMSSAHLLEIDLLRQGQRVPMQERLPPYPYFVFLSRVNKRPLTDVWPIQFDQPLPTVPVPLLPGDADVPLDLQAVFTATYDIGGYDLVFDYRSPPQVPLDGKWATWAEERLQAAGLREGE
ncbi:MAG: DUF4058 family protein [Anaerolineae bacterium]|nr:DUF4058 family protein [Anaerolineae bacterium]